MRAGRSELDLLAAEQTRRVDRCCSLLRELEVGQIVKGLVPKRKVAVPIAAPSERDVELVGDPEHEAGE